MFQSLLNFLRIALTIVNLIFFFGIVLNTAITVKALIISIFLYSIIGVLIFRWVKKEWFLILAKYDYFVLLMPLIFNSFFVLNYLFSKDESVETYAFEFVSRTENKSSNSSGHSTTIILENNAYQNIFFFRTFPDYMKMHGKNTITYQFAEGFFGLKVIKDYEFSRENLNFEDN